MAGYSNDRFLFEDPFSKTTMNRTTRYREKRRRLNKELHENEPSTAQTEPEILNDIDVSLTIQDETTLDMQDVQYDDEDDVEDHEDNAAENSYDSSESDVDDESTSRNKLLYDGAPLTTQASNALIMEYKMCHGLSKEALKDLLQLIQFHCPKPNECIISPYVFKKLYISTSSKLHYYCSICYETVTEHTIAICTNPLCKADLSQQGSRSYFIEEEVDQQLKNVLKRKLLALKASMGVNHF